jgi:hypothetical protein
MGDCRYIYTILDFEYEGTISTFELPQKIVLHTLVLTAA